MQEFNFNFNFSFNFPLREYFFVIRPSPNKFSNGPSLRKVMSGMGGGGVGRERGFFEMHRLFFANIFLV